MRLVTSGLALLLAATAPALAAEDKLAISGGPPPAHMQFFSGTGWTIYLDGIIDPESDKRFADFLKKNDPPPYSTMVVLNSQGGNPLTAMAIGRMIRERGYGTDVEKSQSQKVAALTGKARASALAR